MLYICHQKAERNNFTLSDYEAKKHLTGNNEVKKDSAWNIGVMDNLVCDIKVEKDLAWDIGLRNGLTWNTGIKKDLT